jgi:hypothetical protein
VNQIDWIPPPPTHPPIDRINPPTHPSIHWYTNTTQACRSRGRLYVGGAFNLVGDNVAFNFGYFEGGNWTSPPVTIGPDPMTLLYHDDDLQSPDSQGKGARVRASNLINR